MLVSSGVETSGKKTPEPKKGRSLLEELHDYVVLDLETTGLNPVRNEIIEVAAVKVRSGQITDSFSSLVKPERRIDSFITGLTGISNDMVADAPPIRDVLSAFLRFVEGEIVVGHNVNFDIGFLHENCRRLFGCGFSNDYVDTLRLSRKLFPEQRHHRLCDLEQRFGLHNERAHRALSDVMLTNDCYQILCRHMAESTPAKAITAGPETQKNGRNQT